jgi:hypothetical protein
VTVGEIKRLVVEQFGQSPEEARQHMPKIISYINDGYDLMLNAWKPRAHVGDEEYPRLVGNDETPAVPDWLHGYLADYATFLIYRNGNPQRQQRGVPFLSRWLEGLTRLRTEGDGGNPGYPARFHNLGPWRGEPAASRREAAAPGFDPF